MVLKGNTNNIVLLVGVSDQKTLVCVTLQGLNKQLILSFTFDDLLGYLGLTPSSDYTISAQLYPDPVVL